MIKRFGIYNLVLLCIILICLFLISFQNTHILSGKATAVFATSNVSVSKYLSISFSSNLSEGILFGDVAVLPASNVNASHNYDGTSDGSTLYIAVSEDGNTPVDFCIKADGDMMSLTSDALGLTNETYSNSTSTNVSLPELSLETSLTTSYVKSGDNVALGDINYYRFWLDIPAAQPSGDYNNTVSFKGIQTGVNC